ncbi:MAG: hypothetical protein GX275_02285 [Clostridiales bacterium]|nr:hypothetical protein [Clostridiales bacterium]
MLNVSENFNKAVKENSRLIKARATIELQSSGWLVDEFQASSTFDKSIIKQSHNTIRYADYRLASLEKDYIKLDGSTRVFDNKQNNGIEIGWWSDNLSDEYGNINESLTYIFLNSASTEGLGVVFDREGEVYPTEFTIQAGDRVIEVTGNQKPYYQIITHIDNVSSLVITFKKMNKPYVRAKVIETDFGIIEDWTDDNIIKVNMIQEIDISLDTIPTNTLSITVDNTDRRYDMFSNNSIIKYFSDNKPIKFYFGAELLDGRIEWCPMEEFYYVSPKLEEGALTATFEFKNYVNTLENDTTDDFRMSVYHRNSTLYERNFYDDGGIIPLEAPDSILNDLLSDMKYCMLEDWININKKDLLLKIASCYQLTPLISKKKIKLIDVYNLSNTGFIIDLDNSYEKPKIEKLENVKEVSITGRVYSYEGDETTDNYNYITISEDEYTVFYSKSPVWYEIISGSDYLVSRSNKDGYKMMYDGFWYVNPSYNAFLNNHSVGIKRASGEGSVTLNLSLKYNNDKKYERTEIFKSTSKEGKSIKIDSDSAWHFYSRATADYYFGLKGYKITSNWRGNPAIECGDKVIVEDGYGNLINAIVTKQTFDYQGDLRVNTELIALESDNK